MKMLRLFGYLWLNRIIFYSALLVGCLMAFTPGDMGLQPQFNDKLLHASGFFVMAFLSHLAHPNKNSLWLIFGLTLFGVVIELVQAYLPYRTFSLWDWFADILGLLLYFGLLAVPLKNLLRIGGEPD